MNTSKVIVLAEIPVAPEHFHTIAALSAATLEKTLQEPGCESFYQTRKIDDPLTLIFFEVFRSREDHNSHLEADYTKALSRQRIY